MEASVLGNVIILTINQKMKALKEKRKEVVRGLKFVLFSISAGIIEFVSFALLDAFIELRKWELSERP